MSRARRRGLTAAALATVAAALLLTFVHPAPAGAHAVVTASTPTDGQTVAEPPDEVQVTFSEPVSSDLGGLTVLDSSGQRVDNDDSSMGATGTVLRATVRPELPDGTYVMNYRVVSTDGHPISGAIVFGVGEQTVIDASGVTALEAGQDSGWELAAGIARFLTYSGALLAAGLAVFVMFVHDQRPDRRRLATTVRVSAVLGGIGAVATVALQAALLTGEGFDAMTDVTTLRQALTEGLDWATVVLLFGLASVHLSTDATKPVVSQGLAFYGSLVVAASFAFWGHSTTADPAWLAFVADAVHVLAAAIWFGGLVGLTATLWLRRRPPVEQAVPVAVGGATAGPHPRGAAGAAGEQRSAEDALRADLALSTAHVVSRFSALAAGSVVLLAAAGVALAWDELGGLSDLTGTDYGRLLLVKVAVVGLVLLGAAYNRWALVPRIARDAEVGPGETDGAPPSSASGDTALRHLRSSVAAEVVALVLVLGLTSALVNITPPSSAAAGTASSAVQTAPVRDTSVEVALLPADVGGNSVHITYFDEGNRPEDIAQQVAVELTQPAAGIGPITRDAVKAASGHYIVNGLQIPTGGDWELELITRISDFDQERTTFTFSVGS